MDKKKILFVAQEIAPYLPTTPIAEFTRMLPQSIQEKGMEVRTFMPKYGMINERRNQLHEVIRLSGMNITIDDNDHPLIIKVASLQPSRMQVYFIDNEDYFQRTATKLLETLTSTDDNDERMIFFARGVIETVKKLRWEPDIVNTIGWISALIPPFVKHIYNEDPSFRNAKVVITLVDDSFDYQLNSRFAEKLIQEGLGNVAGSLNGNVTVDYLQVMKFALDNADGVVIQSDNIPEELLSHINDLGLPKFIPDEQSETLAQDYLEFYQTL